MRDKRCPEWAEEQGEALSIDDLCAEFFWKRSGNLRRQQRQSWKQNKDVTFKEVSKQIWLYFDGKNHFLGGTEHREG